MFRQLCAMSVSFVPLQGRAADELAGWEAAPFAEAVLQQRRSRPLLWAAAHLLK